jgi:predicted RNA-binding protein with PIN domain
VGPELVLVDGYNIIFAWEDLRQLAQTSLDAARARLIERLRNYQGWRECPVIVVFDAYKVKGNPGSVEQLGGVSVVYTKEAETADMYIEKTAHDLSRHYRVRVATSDALEQVIILGGGALRVPASAFEQEVQEVESAIRGFLQG